MPKAKDSSLADKLFPIREEPYGDSILSIPPEQRRLHTETYDFSISTIYEKLTVSKGIFIPEFQRRYVWTKAQASRLIESLIIQCPIPVIYLSQEKDERLSVIDGNQRLQSIRKFLNNDFELTGLTAYPELDGLRFDELDPRFQRHIHNRTLRCITIMKDTHPQVKFDVFERLNTGAVELAAQELRHGLYHGRFVEWVGQTAKHPKWRELVRAGSNKRMKAEEFLVRFLAFHNRLEAYEKPLANFLNLYTEQNRDAPDDVLNNFTVLFEQTINIITAIFGDLAFAIFDPRQSYKVLSPFNAALFDAEMIAVSRAKLKPQEIKETKKKAFLGQLGEMFYEVAFQQAIARATSDADRIKTRVHRMQDLVAKHF